jgi:hypothetical protein
VQGANALLSGKARPGALPYPGSFLAISHFFFFFIVCLNFKIAKFNRD